MKRQFLGLIVCLAVLSLISSAHSAPIHDAAAKGDIAKVKALLNSSPSLVNAVDKDGATPLHHAVAAGSKEIVELLLSKGADVNAKKKDGVTPLHVAAALGQVEIAKLLIEKGADVHSLDVRGRTPKSIAELNGYSALMLMMLDVGKSSGNPKGGTAAWAHILLDTVSPERSKFASVTCKLVKDLYPVQYSGRKTEDHVMQITVYFDKPPGIRDIIARYGPADKVESVQDKTDDDGAESDFEVYRYGRLAVAVRKGDDSIYRVIVPLAWCSAGLRETAEKELSGAPLESEPTPQMAVSGRLLPHFIEELSGSNEVRVKNPNDFSVKAGIRSGDRGKDVDVPANGTNSVYIPDGKYDIYFVYSNKPDALFQGDSFTLNNNGVEIQIVKVVDGNYNIRQVR